MGFSGSVTTDITSVGSLFPNVPEQGRGKEAGAAGGSWRLLPSAQLSPVKLLKQLLTSPSFRGCVGADF